MTPPPIFTFTRVPGLTPASVVRWLRDRPVLRRLNAEMDAYLDGQRIAEQPRRTR